MAIENLLHTITLPAAADLSASQFCFVKLDGSANAALAGAGEDAIGVLQNKPTALGRAATIENGHGAITKLKVGDIVAIDADVASDSTGRGVTAVSGDYILAKAIEASTGANQIISVIYGPRGGKV